MNKEEFQKLKGRRIYQFYLDEETGKITDITDSMNYVKVIRCKDCKHHYTDRCAMRYQYIDNQKVYLSSPMDFCSFGERKEEDAIPVEWIEKIIEDIGNDSPYRPAIEWLLITYRMEKEE